MVRKNSRITLLNTISTLLLQIVLIFSGFIIPKIILDTFGSNVNGLISSLTQFLNYITLVEGGITGVIAASLYKPLIKHDNKTISSILSTAKTYYKGIGIAFVVYAIILSLVYPLLFNTGFTYAYVASLTLILSISLTIQYMLSLTYKTLLNSDKKIYVVSFTQMTIRIAEILLAYVSVKIFPSVHILKFLASLLFIIQPIIFSRYVKKHYKLDTKGCEKTIIKGRWDGFAINTAAFIHNSTDIAILTIFTNLATVSVYSVYALVTTGIKSLVNSLVSSLNPTLGHVYAEGNYKKLNDKLDMYEYIVFMTVSLLFSVSGLLITPFVMIYTDGLVDADYYQPIFGILIIVAEAIYLLKYPHLNMAYAANKFKEISKPAFIEAGVNIIVSIALVPFLGLIGVVVGTIVAMIYRLVFHVYYTTKIVPGRKQWRFYKKLLAFLASSTFGIALCLLMPTPNGGVIDWCWHAIAYSFIILSILLINSLLFFKNEIITLKQYIKR